MNCQVDILINATAIHNNTRDAALPDDEAPVCNVRSEMKLLVDLAAPILVSTLCAAILPLTSLIYAARLEDSTTLAGISLAVSVCNVSGMCIYCGMATGIDTLASQAFGAQNNRLVGVVFARGTLLTAFIFVPVTILWYYMDIVVVTLGQSSAVAEVTGAFTRAYVWGMVPYVVFENAKRCLQFSYFVETILAFANASAANYEAQNIALPEMVVALLGVVANIAFHELTMGILGWGAYGAGLALSMTGFFMLGSFVAAIWLFRLGCGDWWSGICSTDAFLCWPEYLRLCIPGLAGVFVEWTAWEASAFIAGMAGKEELAIQGIILSTYAVVFSVALSISIGANNCVGNRLGERKPGSARESAWCAIRVAIVSALLVGGGLGFGAHLWPRLFGVSESVIAKIINLAPWYAAVQILDIVQISCTGILKGMGLQRVQAQATFIFFYLGAVPLMAYLVINRKCGVRGLWVAIGAAEVPLLVFYLYVIYNVKWEDLAEAAQRRLSIHSLVSPTPVSSDPSDLDYEEGGGGSEVEEVPHGGYYGSGDVWAAGGYSQGVRAHTADGGGAAIYNKSRLTVLVTSDSLMVDNQA